MVSTPYYRGRSREYQALRMLRSEGWFCSRSAMSHGPVDIFAGKDGRTLMIQVKSGKARIRPDESNELMSWAEAFNADAEIWFFKTRGPLVRKTIRRSDVDSSKKARPLR